MIDGVPAGVLDNISSVALVVLFALALGTGRVFTKRQYDEVVHDRNEWRTESRLKDAQIAEKDRQLSALSEVGRTIEHVMGSLQDQDRGNS